MKFYLMRHCAVDIPTGQPKPEDIPLDPVGELQAHVMRKFLKRVDVWPDVIISSDLPRAEDTAKIIDEEVKKIIDECYGVAKSKLFENKDKLDLLAKRLIEKETLDESEVRQLLGFEEKAQA